MDIVATVRKANQLKSMHIHGIITSDPVILQLLLKKEHSIDLSNKSEVTLNKYQGAMFSMACTSLDGTGYRLPVVVIDPPDKLSYSMKQRFLTEKFISKLYDRSWFTAPQLDWELGQEETLARQYKEFNVSNCILIGVDIETKLLELDPKITKVSHINDVPLAGTYYTGAARTGTGAKAQRQAELSPIITCVGYCGVFTKPDGSLYSKTVVIPMKTQQQYRWMKKFNQLPAPKSMQNGRYDSSYFLRYDAPLYNWVYDTYGLMHCWMVELPRNLAMVSALCIRNHMYWKDESSGNLYEYNAKDCHATAWSTLVLLSSVPEYAHTNYVSIFKQVFPCISCGIEGWLEDSEEATNLWRSYQDEIVADKQWWNTVIKQDFNVRSPNQVKQLFQSVLRTGVKKTDKIALTGIVHKHPLWRLMVDKLLQTRKYMKADSTYLNVTTFVGRIMYELDPFGTDTGRFSSKDSNFWCGTQIQNIPAYVKSMFIADDGWELGAIDNAQSESRTTAYITGDPALIDAVENAPDFHTRNCSIFFGIPEEELFHLKETNLPLYKKYRNKIGKRVNHGANYNMGESVLINTMTPEGIIEAKHTLQLPSDYTFEMVAKYLLHCFDRAYPLIRSKEEGGYHKQIIDEVAATSTLVTPNGWTRFTFHRPADSKKDLNALVAHKPQSWSVMIINEAFFDAWWKYQIAENKCRIKAQVHDEIVFQTRPQDTQYVNDGISALMKRPNPVTLPNGTEMEMIIPNDPVPPAQRWSQLKD